MQAGTGSSMTRTTYLARILGIPPEAVKIGAKGTDLFIEVADPKDPTKTRKVLISLVEAQLLQAIHDAKAGLFARIDLHDILSTETKDSLEAVWNKKSLIEPDKTYAELVNGMTSLTRSGHTQQAYMPTLDREGNVTFGRTAPGGHALFAVDALRAAIFDILRPNSEGRPLISVIGNGEDLSSTPDPAIVGWMIESKAPIVMVTTEKTPNDMKGGQIALAQRDTGTELDPRTETFATLIEAAQAKAAGQLELFEKLGLRPNDKMAFFNTNMALFNYEVLVPKLKKLYADVGEVEFMRIISPDLINNWKGDFLQLEGAMGSCLLNLDRYWRKTYGEPLIHIVNVGHEHRTKYYSPIKSAFDYFMQFHSDRFTFDSTAMRLINKRPGVLPSITLTDKHYADVENVLNAFTGASLLNLESLKIEGQVALRGVALRGTISIVNHTGNLFDLAAYLKSQGKADKLVLENVSVEITAGGAVSLKPLSAT